MKFNTTFWGIPMLDSDATLDEIDTAERAIELAMLLAAREGRQMLLYLLEMAYLEAAEG